jgi:TRAP-type mannitol/chloroaromatic compound transport system permease small subunit
VRIDLISGRFPNAPRAWIDIFGILFFLMPMAVAMIMICPGRYSSTPLRIGEMSNSAGGL